jgi:prophage DNA circulation protein
MKPASFRGVPFHVDDHQAELGARNIIHEYPGSDVVDAEPSGRHPLKFTIQAHLIGDGWEKRRKALEAALDEPGTGPLVHPEHGNKTVAICDGPARVSWQSKALGMARIDFTFVVIGPRPKSAPMSLDTGRGLLDAAEGLLGALQLGRLDTSGFNFIQRAARAVLQGPRSLTRALAQVNSRIRSTIGIVDDFSDAIDDFTDEVVALLNTPTALATAIKGLMNSVLRAVTSVERNVAGGDSQRPGALAALAVANLGALLIGDLQDDVDGTTPAREQQRTNQAELVDIVEAAALAETVSILTEVEPDSEAQAGEILATINDVFERLLLRGTLDSEAERRLLRMRALFHQHMRRSAVDLSGLDLHTPTAAISAVQLAYQLYGDATRESEIVLRNNPEHPGMLHASVTLGVARE